MDQVIRAIKKGSRGRDEATTLPDANRPDTGGNLTLMPRRDPAVPGERTDDEALPYEVPTGHRRRAARHGTKSDTGHEPDIDQTTGQEQAGEENQDPF